MDKMLNVDLKEALQDISRNNTFHHREFDLGISFEQMSQALKLDDGNQNTLIWVSYPSGIDCYPEWDVYQQDTRSYNGVQYHAENARRDRKLAYAVQVLAESEGRLYGNLFEIDIRDYWKDVHNHAVMTHTVRLYLDAPSENGRQETMPKYEFDQRYPTGLPKMFCWRNEPYDTNAFRRMLDFTREERKETCEEKDKWLHISDLYDSRLEFFTKQIVGDLNRLPKPNSQDGQAFSVDVEYHCLSAYTPSLFYKLLDALPYNSAALMMEKGARDLSIVVPRDEILHQRQVQQGKPSIMAQLNEGKKAAEKADKTAASAPKRDNELGV